MGATLMTRKEVKIKNALGIHARPAGMIANTSSTFKSEVRILKDNLQINAKSIMGVMSLAAGKGSYIIIEADGIDEKEAVQAVVHLFESKFDEE
jgi:phosphocarrier protein